MFIKEKFYVDQSLLSAENLRNEVSLKPMTELHNKTH